jgi:hypothetical protein
MKCTEIFFLAWKYGSRTIGLMKYNKQDETTLRLFEILVTLLLSHMIVTSTTIDIVGSPFQLSAGEGQKSKHSESDSVGHSFVIENPSSYQTRLVYHHSLHLPHTLFFTLSNPQHMPVMSQSRASQTFDPSRPGCSSEIQLISLVLWRREFLRPEPRGRREMVRSSFAVRTGMPWFADAVPVLSISW